MTAVDEKPMVIDVPVVESTPVPVEPVASRASWLTASGATSTTLTTAQMLGGTAATVTAGAVGAGLVLTAAAVRKFAPGFSERVGLRTPDRSRAHKITSAGRSGKGLLGGRRGSGGGSGRRAGGRGGGLLGAARKVAGRNRSGGAGSRSGQGRGRSGVVAGRRRNAAGQGAGRGPGRKGASTAGGRKGGRGLLDRMLGRGKGTGSGAKGSKGSATGKGRSGRGTGGKGSGRKGSGGSGSPSGKKGGNGKGKNDSKGKGGKGNNGSKNGNKSKGGLLDWAKAKLDDDAAGREAARRALAEAETSRRRAGILRRQEIDGDSDPAAPEPAPTSTNASKRTHYGSSTMPNPFDQHNEAMVAVGNGLEVKNAMAVKDWVTHAPDAALAQAGVWDKHIDEIDANVATAPEFVDAMRTYTATLKAQQTQVQEAAGVFTRRHAEQLADIEENNPRKKAWDISANQPA